MKRTGILAHGEKMPEMGKRYEFSAILFKDKPCWVMIDGGIAAEVNGIQPITDEVVRITDTNGNVYFVKVKDPQSKSGKTTVLAYANYQPNDFYEFTDGDDMENHPYTHLALRDFEGEFRITDVGNNVKKVETPEKTYIVLIYHD